MLKPRGFLALTAFSVVLSGCARAPVGANEQAALFHRAPGIPFTIIGSLPGYSNETLQVLAGQVVAHAAFPPAVTDAPEAGWNLKIYMGHVDMPRVRTVTIVSLCDGRHVVATDSQWVDGPSIRPRLELKRTLSELTAQLRRDPPPRSPSSV
jgi:hypothetical protein